MNVPYMSSLPNALPHFQSLRPFLDSQPSLRVIQLQQILHRSLSQLVLHIEAFFRIHTRPCNMSSPGSSRPSGFTSPLANRRRPLRNSNTSVQDRVPFESILRTSGRTIQSIRRHLGMIGIERDRSFHDLNNSVQNLALRPSSTSSRSELDCRTQELIERLDPRNANEAALLSALQEARAQPSPTRTRNDSQLRHRESFAPYPARSGPMPGNKESGSQPTPLTLGSHQQTMARTRPMPYRPRTGGPTMLLPDPQSTPLRERFIREVGRQINDTYNASQRAESSSRFSGNLRVPQSQEKLSLTLYGTKRSATQGPAKEAETNISTATTEEGWEMVAPSRGNGFTTGTLKRIDELRAQRQKAFGEYMEETAEWIDCADEKLDKYRSKSEAFREYQRSGQYRSKKRTGDDNINRRAQRRGPAEENVVHGAHEEAEPSLKDTCLNCFNEKCEGCSGR